MPEFHFIGPDDVPEEIKEAIMAQQDQQRMGIETIAHDVQRLFRELDETQLGTLRYLVHTIAHNPEAGFYYEGILTTLYSIKANVCPACGKNHDEEARKAMEEGAVGVVPPVGSAANPAPIPNVVTRVEMAVREANGGELPQDMGAAVNKVYEAYNMRPANEEQDGSATGAVCLGCGLRYVSLEDRLVERPGAENCTGCVQKAKWG